MTAGAYVQGYVLTTARVQQTDAQTDRQTHCHSAIVKLQCSLVLLVGSAIDMFSYFIALHCIARPSIYATQRLHVTRSSTTAKSTARPSCLVGVLYHIVQEKIR